MLFDSHCHLDDSRYDEDREQVLARAAEAGVKFIVNPGADLETSRNAVDMAAKHANIYAAVGVHPHDAKDMDDDVLKFIAHLAVKPKVVAIGEIGLDFHYDFSPREVQRHWFIEQIHLAKGLGLPIVVHDREANQEIFDTLKAEKAFETGVLLHCYSGSAELAKQYLKHDAMLSIAGPITFSNARKTVEVVQAVPLEHLLIETDGPYLAPVPYRGKRNEPAYVRFVAEKIADIKGISVEEVGEQTCRNALGFFKIKG